MTFLKKVNLSLIFNIISQVFIFISILSLSIETFPNLQNIKTVFYNLEIMITIFFFIEYLIRIYFSKQKIKYIFSFLGIIDLLTAMPFFLLGLDARVLKIFRLFSFFKILKLVRYNSALSRIKRAFIIAKEEIMIFLVTLFLMLYFVSVAIYYFENPVQPEVFSSVFDSFWWAVVTLTTVGYGDIVPISIGGRIFTIFFLIIGLGIVAAPTGLLASAMSSAREENK